MTPRATQDEVNARVQTILARLAAAVGDEESRRLAHDLAAFVVDLAAPADDGEPAA